MTASPRGKPLSRCRAIAVFSGFIIICNRAFCNPLIHFLTNYLQSLYNLFTQILYFAV